MIEGKLWKCLMCEADVHVDFATDPHPGAPDLMSVPEGVFFGLVRGETGAVEDARVIVLCSTTCVRRLYAAGYLQREEEGR